MLKIAGTQFQLKFSLWIKVVGESSWRNNQKCRILNEKCENEYFLRKQTNINKDLQKQNFQQIFRQEPMQKSTENIAKTRNENTPNFYNTGLYWYVDVRIMDIIVS